MNNKAQSEEAQESFKLGLGGRDAGGQGRERGPPDVSPRGRGVGSREDRRRARGGVGETARGSQAGEGGGGGGVPKRSGRPRPPPQPGGCPVTHPLGSCGLRPGCLGRRPPGPGSVPTSRAGGPVGWGRPTPHVRSPPPSSPASLAAETCAEPGPRRHRREGGWSTAAQRRAESAGVRFAAAAAAAAMAEPAGLKPRPGKRRLRGGGGSAVTAARFPAEPRLSGPTRSCSCSFSPPPPPAEPEPEPERQGRGLAGRGLGRLHKACAARGAGTAGGSRWVFP